ncbi:hypothetical protein J3R30DRAFT_3294094, partial [Lentinula aciculospora]
IWHVYLDEAAVFDDNMIGEMRDALDMLLIFVQSKSLTALFSAIITTFVVQTYQQLSQDYSQMTAYLLYEPNQIQWALAYGTSLDVVSPSSISPTTNSTPEGITVWTNALWFTSLTLLLVTVFAAVLVKQWL